MSEVRGTWGAGIIAGYGAKLLEFENQADETYTEANPMGVESNKSTSIFKEKMTKKGRETINGKTGVNELSLTNEREDYANDDREPTYETQLNPKKFTGGVTISEELRDDADADIEGELSAAKDLKVSYAMTVNRHKWSIQNYGFTAQASLPDHLSFYGDGKAVYASDHPIKNSISSTTTQDNDSTVVFSETNLETGLLAVRNQLNDRGMLGAWGSGPMVLSVPIALEKTAKIITKSTKRSDTGNNDMNVYYDGSLTLVSTKWLGATATGGSDTAWHLCDSMRSPFIFLNRRGYTPDTWIDPYNKDFRYDVSCRYIVGNKEWKGTWGSTGAG